MSVGSGAAIDTVVMGQTALTTFLRAEFPQSRVSIEAVSATGVKVRQLSGFEHLRPVAACPGRRSWRLPTWHFMSRYSRFWAR